MKAAPYIAAAVGCTVLIGAAYGTISRAGYVISKDEAERIASATVRMESVERMEFQLEYKLSELRRYYAIEHKTPADLVQIRELEAQIESLRRRIAKARGQE